MNYFDIESSLFNDNEIQLLKEEDKGERKMKKKSLYFIAQFFVHFIAPDDFPSSFLVSLLCALKIDMNLYEHKTVSP